MLKPRLYMKGLSGLLSPGKEKKGKENETNGKAHPVKATHFDYITTPGSSSNSRSSQDRPRAPKPHQPQGHSYSRSSSSRQDRPPREDRRHHRHSTGEYRNGSSSMQHYHSRSNPERRYSREDDEELMRIHSQQQKYDDRGERRSGSLPGHYSHDSRGKNRGGSLPGHYSQGSPTTLQGPPKPPRRQESLNKVHIPEGPPDTDFTTSASDYEVFSPSSGSSSPKNWKVSPLLGQNSSSSKHLRDRSYSPSKDYSRTPPRSDRSPDRKQRHYDSQQYDYNDPYGRDRSTDRKQKHYDNHQNERNGHHGKRDTSPDKKQRHYNSQRDERSDHYDKRDMSPERKQRLYNNQQEERNGHYGKRDISQDRKLVHHSNQQDSRIDHYGKRDRSQDRKQKPYNQQDERGDYYGKRDRSVQRQDLHYSSIPQPSGNGYQKENKIKQPSVDPYRHDTGPSPYSHSPSSLDQYSYERTPTAYEEDYQQREYNQQQKQKVTPDPYGNSWIKEKPLVQSRPTSNARPLVLPQGDKVPEAPRPIYRSDGEIDLREPTYQKSREPDMFAIKQAPPSHSYPSSPVSKSNTSNFNYYPEPYTVPEPREMQWEEPNQQIGQNQPKQSNSLRTVRGVKAYDQHMKKFKRPTSLGGVPRQPQNTFSQERPKSAIVHPASDDGLYPTLEHSKNSAFAAGSPKHSYTDSLYNNQFGVSATNNNHQYSEPKKPTSHANDRYGMDSHQTNQAGIYGNVYNPNKGSNLLPKDWPKDYPAQMTVRSPVPSDPENAVNSIKQVDSGKQTIFCLVSQVVPTSPSPETTPGPMQREFVEIENGKVSPVMKQPINVPRPPHSKYNQNPVQNGYSQHGSYSPVRSQMEYQANQVDPAWKQHVQKWEGRQSAMSSISQDSSTGNDSDFYSRQRPSPAGYSQQVPKVVPAQIVPKKDPVNMANPRESYRGASLSSGYHSSPEFEREHGRQPPPQKAIYERERFSDTEYRNGGTGQEIIGDDINIVPIQDLIKKIQRDVETNGGLDLIVPKRPAPADLKTILVKDAQQSNQQIKDDTCYGIAALSMDPKVKETPTQTKVQSGKMHPNAYYNEKYITATALPCEVIDTTEKKAERKAKVGARPSYTQVPVTANIYQEVESRPDIKQESSEESEEEAKPINAKERRAYFESLKPLSREEEIMSVVASKSPTKNQTEVPASSGKQKVASHPNAMYGSIKWPKDYPVTEPGINKQTAKQNFSAPPKARKAERSPSPIRRSEVFSDDDESKPGERQGYYDRLKQRGQGAGPGLMGKRSQSLPKLNSRARDEKSVSFETPGPSVELANGESGSKRLSMGAQLFQQKRLEMERHNKKQEILDKVKSQLQMKRSGSEPDLTKKDKEMDALHSLEQNTHLLSTHVAGKRIRGRDSADFEYALNQLQTIHTEADQDADDILHPQYYRPFDHRAAEIPLLAQKVAELQELIGVHASPGSVKQRKKAKRATSDVSGMKPSLNENNDGELQERRGSAKKGQDFFPYRQATHPKKMAKKDELNLGCGHESTSDEDKTPRPNPPGTNTKLYRHPKSSDNLGFSSDSSPERPIRVKPKIVLPDHVRLASPELSASREHRRATRDAFFSGEDNSRGPSPLPMKTNSNRKPNNNHHTNLPPPIMQSVKFGESPKLKRAVLTKPPPAPALTKFKESQVHLQPPGSRDSVSTVDSACLAQPFEDMTEEYQNMMMDHQAVEMSMPNDPERTSSVESLMHLVSGSHRQHQKKKAQKTNPNSSYSPGGNIPLADEEEYFSSGGEEADLEDLEVPDPSELKWQTTPLSHGPLPGEGGLYSDKPYQEHRPHSFAAPPVLPDSTSGVNSFISSVYQQDQSPDTDMSTRGDRSVTKLQEKYGTERPLSFDSSTDRRTAYVNSSRSLKSLDSNASNRPSSRYSQDRSSSGSQHPHRSSGDFTSARSDSYGTQDTKPSSHHHQTMSHIRTGSASDAHPPPGKHRGFQDDRAKIPGDLKRGSTESGYGSLDKDKIRRGNYIGSTSGDSNPVNAIRDKYLVNRPLSTSNGGDASRTYGTRAIATPPQSVSDSLARALHSGSESEDSESRAARIARYKEQRRRELAEKYGLGPSSSDGEASSRRRFSSQKEEASPTSERGRKLSNASDRSSNLDASPLSRRYPSKESLSSITGEVESIHTNGNTSQDNSPATTPRLSRKARRDSNISTETQDFIDALEASRAARRERLRRSETEDTSDTADRLIARHRRRKSSVGSNSDVFESPHRSGSRGRHEDYSDSDSVTSSASVDRPSRRHLKSDRTDIRESRRRQETLSACTAPVSEQDARDSIRLMITNINNLLAATNDDSSDQETMKLIKLKKKEEEQEKNLDDSDNDVDDSIFDMEDSVESKDSGISESKSPDSGGGQSHSENSGNNNNKPSRDKRKRHNQAITMEDIQKASKLKNTKDQVPTKITDKSKEKDASRSPRIIEPPVQPAKTSPQELSPRSLKAGGFKIETVTKTELKNDANMPKPGDQTVVLKRAASPIKDISKRASWGSNKSDPSKDSLKPAAGRQTEVNSSTSSANKVKLRKPEIPKSLQDTTRDRKNSDSSISTSESFSVSPTRKPRGGSFSQRSSDSEKSGSLQRPKSMNLKDSKVTSQSKEQKTRVSSSPEKKRLSKTMSSPERKPPKKSDPKTSAERKLSSASSTSSSAKSSQVDKRTSYPPAKTTSPDRKPLSRRQSSPEKKLTTRQASPEKKLTTRQPSPEKKVSKTTGEKKLTRQASTEKKSSRTTSPEKRVSGMSSADKKLPRTTSPDKRASKTSPTEKKDIRAASPEKRPSTKRTASPVKKPSVKKDAEAKTSSKKATESTKAAKDVDNKKKESKTNGIDASKKTSTKSESIEKKVQVNEEIIPKKIETKEEATPTVKEPEMPQPVVTIIAPAPERKPSHAKRIRSRTIEVTTPSKFGPGDPKREALTAKDDELFAMMQLRAQQIREEEEKEGKVEESGEEEDRSVSEERPEDVIKVSLKDRMQSFKGKESKPTLVDYSKLPVSPTPKRTSKMLAPPEGGPEPVNVKQQNGDGGKSGDDETAEEEDQLAGLSLSEKMKMFTQMSAIRKKAQEEEDKRSKTKSSSRFHRTRGRERFQTQPVTPEELTSASSLAKEMAAQARAEQEEVEEKSKREEDIAREVKREEIEEQMNTQDRIREEIRRAKLQKQIENEQSEESDDTSSRLPSMAEEEEPLPDVQEDECSKLTLSEKMRLFKEKSQTPTKPPPKVEPPKRKRRSESRFRTQPITVDEVKKAAVSPLAKSFSRPPSMEVLGALPISQQISMVYGESKAPPSPATMNGRSVTSTRRSSTSNVKEEPKETPPADEQSPKKEVEPPAIKQSPQKEVEVKPTSYKENVKKQKNLMALLASEIKGSSKADEDEEVEHPKSEAVDASIKMARLGLATPTEEKKQPVFEPVQTKPVAQTKAAPVAASRKIDNIPEKSPPSPKTRHSLTQQKQGTKEAPPSPKKQLSSPEKKLTKPQPHPRSPQNIRRNGTSKTTKDTAPPSPVAPPRKSKMGSPASMRRQDSRDGDISSGAEDGRKIKNDAAKGSSSEHTTPQRENKADEKGEQWSSESETEVRQRVSPVTEEHVALIKRKQSKKNGFDKRDRNKTQPVSAAYEEAKQAPATPKRVTSHSLRAQNPDRFKTQPVTPDELKQMRQMMDPVQTTSSIKDRLKALQKNGEEGWKQRISKYEDSPKSGLKERLNLLNHNSKFQKNNEVDDLPDQGSISERLQALKEDGTAWRKRIEEKDVDNFTVSGKLKQAGKVSSDEAETKPQTKLRRGNSNRKPRPGSFRITIKRTDSDASINSDSQSSKQENGNDIMSSGLTTTTTESEDSEPDFRVIRTTVTVMKPDDEGFTDFFASSTKFMEETITPTSTSKSFTKKTEKKEATKLTVSDFDALTEGTGHSLGIASAHRRSLRPQRRARPSANPLKQLKTRANVVSEYTEERIELAEVPETKKSKSDSRKENASKVARAGLASKEDIAKGKTKLTTVKDVREMGGTLSELLPYKDLMLIHVKGRRFVQVRLVEPKMTSLNSGDCFILVTPGEIFLWTGEYANVIEKSKATEIAQHIQQKRDLGCKAPSVTEIQETKQKTSHSRGWKRFTELLGGEAKYRDVGAPDEDEMHEIYITETNMVYRVEGDSLEPYEAYWASPGKFNMLDTNEVFVYDFGSEIYIWRGKAASKRKRKAAAQLAQLLWERGFDYSDYDVNPIAPHDTKNMVKNERPKWTLIGKATQHMETILFRHKFIDWPRETDSSKKNGQEDSQKSDQAPELVPFDAKLMIQPSREKPHLILEGTNLGRGDAFFNKIDRKGQKINTLSVVVWHVLEYEHSVLPEESFGQFHEGDTYVIRWLYNVENTGMKSLKGTASKWGGTQGRERCAYFFWQGQQSSINEKGASALMTVELDEERGPQKQVVQGKEPAAFFQLFAGRFVVHVGKREDEETNTTGPLRLYCVRGEHTKETSLMEVPAKMRSLRSRTSFVLLNLTGIHNKKASLHLWHGTKVSKATKECAQHAAAALKEHLPLEAGVSPECSITLEEMEEGKESAAFSKAMGKDRSTYDSAISDPLKYEYTPRLFQLTSGSGVFVSNEILYPARSTEYPSPYPFLQSDLYSGEQPALFALDNHYEIYLWQGWWPADHESASGTTKTGSAKIRWDIDRKLAMETVMAYCKEKRPKNPPKAYLVYAGLEPLTFTNLFPFWDVREDVMKLNKESGKKNDKAILVKDVLAKLTKATYTMEEISKRPLPEGVDPLKLETYLSDKEFKEVLSMTKDEFYKLPMWKQKNLKKTNALF